MHWEEESSKVSCLHTLVESSLNSEVCVLTHMSVWEAGRGVCVGVFVTMCMFLRSLLFHKHTIFPLITLHSITVLVSLGTALGLSLLSPTVAMTTKTGALIRFNSFA